MCVFYAVIKPKLGNIIRRGGRMNKYMIINTQDGFCDGIEFTCNSNKDPESVAVDILENYGYSEFCDENGYYSYNFDLREVAEE